jgi:hypothetical protein
MNSRPNRKVRKIRAFLPINVLWQFVDYIYSQVFFSYSLNTLVDVFDDSRNVNAPLNFTGENVCIEFCTWKVRPKHQRDVWAEGLSKDAMLAHVARLARSGEISSRHVVISINSKLENSFFEKGEISG